jgi:hypothetical protein
MNFSMRLVPGRRVAFSLRTLLMLVALVGAYLAWERHVVLERRAVRGLLEGHGVKIGDSTGPATVPCIRRLFGDRPIQSLEIPQDPKPPAVERAASWFPEAETRDVVNGPGSIDLIVTTIECDFGPRSVGIQRDAPPFHPG